MNKKTTNNFNLKPFYRRMAKYHPETLPPSADFLQWFMGFVEGDGSLAIINPNLILGEQQLVLTITLHEKDKHVLDSITETLGFGTVSSSINNLCIYKFSNLRDISVIIALFNGNTVFPKFYRRFVLFLEKYNTKVSNPKAWPQTKALGTIKLKPIMVRPTLEDAWFSGFTDAEGCFNENLSERPQSRRQWSRYFAVYQSREENVPILEHFKSVFKCGTIQHPKRGDEWVFKVISCDDCVDIIGPYFQRYPLQTVKRETFARWLLVMTVLKQNRYRRCDVSLIYQQIEASSHTA